ncbi:hypothetical protein CROQUDRAFT_660797 [Cronartium quercuum f. sp. fusiforme G11]|uniref:SET domain-containing protein n=1 Tax=Cronartium quercuum f. sp. fusiforme G11 TaxID=708437 RepID=A0A9P6NDX2_9BASI|nr:hypothetical protein CROQUDRAFT_660797 [Cronartium quercuum f. sp. fusiforme G11]
MSSISSSSSPSTSPNPNPIKPNVRKKTTINAQSESLSDSNLYFYGFLLAFLAILFYPQITDYLYANDELYILAQQSAQRMPNISAWHVVEMENRGGGYGVRATRQISPGELLIKEKPLLHLKPKGLAMKENEVELGKMVQDLCGEDRSRFLTLSNAWLDTSAQEDGPLTRYMGILQTNAIAAGSDRGLGIFPSVSRLNHGCGSAANAVYHWREAAGVIVVHSARTIAAGEEIKISYWDSKAVRADRQHYLKSLYNFECNCEVCALTEQASFESDVRLSRINTLKAGLGAWAGHSIDGKKAIETIEEVVGLMREEGLSFEYGQLYADAAHVAAAHSDFQGVRHYAQLAKNHFTIELGPDSVEVLVADKLIRNPTSSTNWAQREPEQVFAARK